MRELRQSTGHAVQRARPSPGHAFEKAAAVELIFVRIFGDDVGHIL
jgi:hypothetical protein